MGLLSRFVGMLTDSRSFLSFPRHEYFRRILCNIYGNDIENGELPNDQVFIGKTIHELDVIDKYHLSVITIIRKREKTNLLGKKFIIKESIGVPFGTTVLREKDILVVFGKTKDILVYCND